MKTLNQTELEAVAGGFPLLAMPAVFFLIPPVVPHPEPSDAPVPSQAAE